jgi:hypothetical protein
MSGPDAPMSQDGIGEDEARRAADDLEKEFNAAIAPPESEKDSDDSKSAPDISAAPRIAGLPAKPKITPLVTEADKKQQAKAEAFKKGLASLPPRPAF